MTTNLDNIILCNGDLKTLNSYTSELGFMSCRTYFIAGTRLLLSYYEDISGIAETEELFKKEIAKKGYDGLVNVQTTSSVKQNSYRGESDGKNIYIMSGTPIKLFETEKKKSQWLMDQNKKESSSP